MEQQHEAVAVDIKSSAWSVITAAVQLYTSFKDLENVRKSWEQNGVKGEGNIDQSHVKHCGKSRSSRDVVNACRKTKLIQKYRYNQWKY